MSLLRDAIGQGVSYGYALHTQIDFEGLRGRPAFEELMRPKG